MYNYILNLIIRDKMGEDLSNFERRELIKFSISKMTEQESNYFHKLLVAFTPTYQVPKEIL